MKLFKIQNNQELVLKIELIFEIKIIYQNFRLIGAIYSDYMGDFCKCWKRNSWHLATLQLTLIWSDFSFTCMPKKMEIRVRGGDYWILLTKPQLWMNHFVKSLFCCITIRREIHLHIIFLDTYILFLERLDTILSWHCHPLKEISDPHLSMM